MWPMHNASVVMLKPAVDAMWRTLDGWPSVDAHTKNTKRLVAISSAAHPTQNCRFLSSPQAREGGIAVLQPLRLTKLWRMFWNNLLTPAALSRFWASVWRVLLCFSAIKKFAFNRSDHFGLSGLSCDLTEEKWYCLDCIQHQRKDSVANGVYTVYGRDKRIRKPELYNYINIGVFIAWVDWSLKNLDKAGAKYGLSLLLLF